MFVMSNSEQQEARARRQEPEYVSAWSGIARRRQVFFCLLLSAFCLLNFGAEADDLAAQALMFV